MKTIYPQLSEWSVVDNNIVEHQNSLNTNKKDNINSNSKLSKLNTQNSDDYIRIESQSTCKPLRTCLSASFCQGLILGILSAGSILAIITALWLTTNNNQTTTTETTSTVINTTTVTTITQTTTTTKTTTTTTKTKTTSTTASTTTTTATISNACTGGASYTVQLLYLSLTATLSWTQYSFNFTAPNINSATLTFAFRNDPSYWYLDDVSVTNSTGTQLLLNPGFEMGNLSKWVYCNPTQASYAGDVNMNTPHTGWYSYQDGSVNASDYLSQAFNVVPNITYSIKFWLSATSSSSTFALVTVSA